MSGKMEEFLSYAVSHPELSIRLKVIIAEADHALTTRMERAGALGATAAQQASISITGSVSRQALEQMSELSTDTPFPFQVAELTATEGPLEDDQVALVSGGVLDVATNLFIKSLAFLKSSGESFASQVSEFSSLAWGKIADMHHRAQNPDLYARPPVPSYNKD